MYLHLVMGVHFLVDFLLILTANRLCGYPSEVLRIILASAVGALYAGACLVPTWGTLNCKTGICLCFLLVVLIAFGVHIQTLRRGSVYLLLKLAMVGVAGFLDGTLLLALGALLLICFFADRLENQKMVPVELENKGKTFKITALRDTGNTLVDPITGSHVLVVAGDVGSRLTGLSRKQLENPISTIGVIPGLRLIPYHSVGRQNGMMLAMKLPNVKIGHRRGPAVVAFAPCGLSEDNTYQALTGGNG